jgi:hypothetical protein
VVRHGLKIVALSANGVRSVPTEKNAPRVPRPRHPQPARKPADYSELPFPFRAAKPTISAASRFFEQSKALEEI